MVLIPINVNVIYYVLPLIISAYAYQSLDYKYVAKLFFFETSILILAQLWLIHIGVGENMEYQYTKTTISEYAYDFGFGNSNTFANILFYSCCYIYVMLYDKSRTLLFITITILSLVTYYYTQSRTAFITCLLLVITCLCPSKTIHKKIYNSIVLYIIPILVSSVFILSPLLIKYSELNSLFSNRIYYSLMLFTSSNVINLLLAGIPYSIENITIDNVFAYMTMMGGLTFVVVFLYQYNKIIKLKHYINFSVLTVLIIVIISGSMEASWAHLSNPGAFFFWILLFNKTIYIKNDKCLCRYL